jgi:hypothetical protein
VTPEPPVPSVNCQVVLFPETNFYPSYEELSNFSSLEVLTFTSSSVSSIVIGVVVNPLSSSFLFPDYFPDLPSSSF